MAFTLNLTDLSKFPSNGKFPVGIQASDANGQPVFYFVKKEDVNAAKYRVQLSIVNTSGSTIRIKKRGKQHTPNINLRFRPGLVDKKMVWDMLPTASELTEQLGEYWKLVDKGLQPDTGVIQVGLRYEGPQDIDWLPEDSFDLQLRPIAGPPLSGDFFLKIALEYDRLYGITTTEEIKRRHLNLAVVDLSGRSQLPIAPLIEGSNTILNDGESDNSFKVMLRNNLIGSSVPFRSDTLDHESGSKITVSIPYKAKDNFDDFPSIIGTKDDLSGANLSVEAKVANSNQKTGWMVTSADDVDGWKIWDITPPTDFTTWYLNNVIATSEGESEVQVNDGSILEYLLFEFNNVKSSGINGLTHIYFHFHHLPGFADHTLLASLEKTPLVVRGQNVGMGKGLSVDGPVSLLFGNKILFKDKNNSTTPDGSIHARDKGGLVLSEGRGGNKTVLEIGSNDFVFRTGRRQEDKSISERMRITAEGDVGIGTDTPKNKLDVKGSVAIGPGYSGTETAPADGLIVEGNVGIGTKNPDAKLEVQGKVRIVGPYENVNLTVSGTSEMEDILLKSSFPYFKLQDTQKVENSDADPSFWKLGTYGEKNRFQVVENDDGTNPKLVIQAGGNVGIGEETPKNKLDIEGAVAIGSGYSGTEQAPDNGLIVEGKVGIGEKNPQSKLQVNGRVRDKTGFLMPVGSVIAYAGATAPDGWLLCDGSEIPAGDDYAELRAVLAGQTKLPDLCGHFVMGAGQYPYTEDDVEKTKEYRLHRKGGTMKETLTIEQMPKHSHDFYIEGENGDRLLRLVTGNKPSGDAYTEETGGDKPHNNLPPYLVLNYIIKY